MQCVVELKPYSIPEGVLAMKQLVGLMSQHLLASEPRCVLECCHVASGALLCALPRDLQIIGDVGQFSERQEIANALHAEQALEVLTTLAAITDDPAAVEGLPPKLKLALLELAKLALKTIPLIFLA